MANGPVGPYTPAVRAGDWLIVSGQIGVADGHLVGGGLEAELRQAMANLAAVLESGGGTMQQLVKTTVFLRHITDYARMNDIYCAALGNTRPARSAVAVSELPMGALVEIEAWAWLGG